MRLGNLSPLSDSLGVSFGSSQFLFQQRHTVVKQSPRWASCLPIIRVLCPSASALSSSLAHFLQKSTCECESQVTPVKPNNLSIFHCTLKPRTRTVRGGWVGVFLL